MREGWSSLSLSHSSPPCSSCVDGYGRSCLVLALLAMMLDEDLPPAAAIEHIRQSRGPAAIQTIKVHSLLQKYSLVPRPCPAFRRLQYGKAGRAWCLFSHEHDIINKWKKKNSEQKSEISYIVQPTISSTLGIHNSYWYHSSSCCSEPQCAHVQLSPFYHLSTLDVIHMRKDTRPSVFFMQPKTLGTRLPKMSIWLSLSLSLSDVV